MGACGADATCLTELKTNTGWQGYSTANSNGQLVASQSSCLPVRYSTCNNLMPLTTYYFANAGNGAAGGASFTTDSSGVGPNDSNDWRAANYFSGTYILDWKSGQQWHHMVNNCITYSEQFLLYQRQQLVRWQQRPLRPECKYERD